MASKTRNRFSSEVRTRVVRLVFEDEKDHSSRWARVTSIAAKIGCTAQSLNEWVKKADVDNGMRGGVPAEIAERLKALERENRELRQANEILRNFRLWRAQGLAAVAAGRLQRRSLHGRPVDAGYGPSGSDPGQTFADNDQRQGGSPSVGSREPAVPCFRA